MVQPLADCDLLALWEEGAQRHPIDRTLLICAFAQPQPLRDELADQPLGSIQRTLLQLQASWFGSGFQASAPCPACDSLQEVRLDSLDLLALLPSPEPEAVVDVLSQRYRLPTSRDLAAVSQQKDADRAARALLERCLLHGPNATARAPGQPLGDPEASADPRVVEAVEAALEAADPAADISLELTCGDCGHGWSTSLDMGWVLWGQISERARALLLDVHDLARGYGWSEPQILALSPWRRAAYRSLLMP